MRKREISLGCALILMLSAFGMPVPAEETVPAAGTENTAEAEYKAETEYAAETGTDEHVHEYAVTEQKSSSCTEDGYIVYTCACGEVYTETVPASGHIAGDPVYENVTEASCTEAGRHDEVIYCAVCGGEISRKTVEDPAPGHTWDGGIVTLEPTAGAEGIRTYTCMSCGEIRTEAIPALPGAISSTCGEDGDTLTWDLDEGGKLTIRGSGKMKDYLTSETGETTPWYEKRNEIREIEICEEVTNIGAGAFAGCAVLKTIRIPATVMSIGKDAFKDCAALETVLYDGSAEEWNTILTEHADAVPENVLIHYMKETQIADEQIIDEQTIEEQINEGQPEDMTQNTDLVKAPVLADGLAFNETAQNLIVSADAGIWIRIADEDSDETEDSAEKEDVEAPEEMKPGGTKWIRAEEDGNPDLARTDAGTYTVYWYYGPEAPAPNESGNLAGQVVIAKADAVVLQAPEANTEGTSGS